MRIALDTNILAYAEGVNGADRQAQALALLSLLYDRETVLPVQALGELYAVLTRKVRLPGDQARKAVLAWRDSFPLVPTTQAVMMAAFDLAAGHRLSIWDATILAAAASAGCTVLLSEDMQDGFVSSGVTVVNPFATALGSAFQTMFPGARM